MRVNVYAEEVTTEVEMIKKTAETGITFYGVRFYLKSPEDLHQGKDDDDRSAITLWVPWTNAEGHDFQKLGSLLMNLLTALAHAEDEAYADKPEAYGE